MAEPTLAAIAEFYAERGGLELLTLVAPKHLLGLWDERFGAPLKGVRFVDRADGLALASALAASDVALLCTGSFRSAYEAWRAGVPRRIGWSRDLRGLLLTDGMHPMAERGRGALARGRGAAAAAPTSMGSFGRFPRYAPRPFGSTLIELAATLGVAVRRTRPLLGAGADVRHAVRMRLTAGGVDASAPFVVLNAGSRPGSAKGWEGWGELLDQIRSDLPVVLACGPGEEPALRDLAGDPRRDGRGLGLIDPVLDLAELAALAAEASLFVTADAGSRHLAAAAGAKLLVLYGPTDPRHTADHLEQTRGLARPVPCAPCHREVCPKTGPEYLACFRGITPAEVAQEIHALV
jgi:heptosyltransferase-2